MVGIEIWRFEMDCWQCETTFSVVYPRGLGGFGGGTWEKAGPQLAEKPYCDVKQTYSKTQGRKVYGNVCPRCDAYCGNHFVYEAVFSDVAGYQSWERAREEYHVVDVIDIEHDCRECGRELTTLRDPPVCEECRREEAFERALGTKTDLEFCEVCDGVLHPEHRANHHTSHEPEETISVCDTCHAKVHHKPGFHDELEPDISRIEAEAQDLV